MGGRSHLRDLFEQFQVLRGTAEFVVADERGNRLAAENTVLFFVNLLEERALIELRSPLQIAQQFFLAGVQDPDLQHRTGRRVVQQVLQAAPGALQLLKLRVVQDFVELNRNQVVDLRDPRVDHRLDVTGDGHFSLEHLSDELLYQVLAALRRGSFAPEPSLFDDLVQQAALDLLLGRRRRHGRLLRITHWALLSPAPAPYAVSPSSRCWKPRPAAGRRVSRSPGGCRADPRAWSSGPACPATA